MGQQFPQQQFKTRFAVLVFIKGAAAPLVLYFEDAKAEYDEFVAAMQMPGAKMIEKEPLGPIKKVSVMSNQIASVAIQEELHP